MSTEIIRIFVLLAIFASVVLLVQLFAERVLSTRSHRSAINKRLAMIGSGADRDVVVGALLKNRPRSFDGLPPFIASWLENFERRVFMSGINLTVSQLLAAMTIGFVFVLLLVLFAISVFGSGITIGTIQLSMLFALALAVMLPNLIVSRIALNRRKKIEQQFPVALDVFVRALRSGHPVSSAIDLLTREMEDPIGTEFGIVSDEVSYGSDLVTALTHMAERWDLDDMKMFVVSLSVQMQTGGNLAEILDNISKVIRDRHQMFLKVRALSSEGRMTGWMLTVLPVGAFLLIFIGSPSFYLDVADDPIFIYGSITLAVLYLTGIYTIRRMIDLKV